MKKKSTFRKPATDAVIEYLQQHKTATFAELVIPPTRAASLRRSFSRWVRSGLRRKGLQQLSIQTTTQLPVLARLWLAF